MQNLALGSLRTSSASYALIPASIPGMDPRFPLSPALLKNAVGSWSLLDMAAEGMSLEVADDGGAMLRYKGCALQATLRVADEGLYTITARHEPASCADSIWHSATYEGVVLAYPLAAGGWQAIVSLSANNGFDSDALLAIGRR